MPQRSLIFLICTFCFLSCYSQNKLVEKFSEPQYPKGEKAFLRLVTDSIDYNTTNAEFKNDYNVKVTIKKDGKIMCNSINDKEMEELSTDELAVYNSINKSLRWKPAYKNGKPIESKLAFKIGLSFQE